MVKPMAARLPDSLPPYTVKLAQPVYPPPPAPGIEEITFFWSMESGTLRTYVKDGEEMECAVYRATTDPDLGFGFELGMLTNTRTQKVQRAVASALYAACNLIATMLVYGEGDPVHNGIGWPLTMPLVSGAADGTDRLRGFSAIIRAIDPSQVPTIDMKLESYFERGRPPA